MMKDVCIVGGGIAGLYMAMLLRQAGIDNIVVIESEKQLGGRVKTARFAGRDVVLGAGIGRAAKDVALGRLMDQLGAPYTPFEVEMAWAPTIPQKYRGTSPETIVRKSGKQIGHVPFGKLLMDVLGPEEYKNLLDASLYTNFESDDAIDVVRDYGMDDNQGGWEGWRIDWKRLIVLLKERVGRSRLMTGRRVVGLKKDGSSWSVELSSGEGRGPIRCRVVIIATDIRTVRALLPKWRDTLYGGIRGQPFMRVYATFDQEGSRIMASAVKTLTIVPRPLKKIIPIDPKRGLYMIAYSDNEDALRVRRVTQSAHKKAVLVGMLQKALGLDPKTQKLRILRLRSHFWPIGTHAYLPLSPGFSSRTDFIRDAQCPEGPDGTVYVVGELVSRQQGWVEGALRSVDRVFRSIVRRVERNNVRGQVQSTDNVEKGIDHGRIGSKKK